MGLVSMFARIASPICEYPEVVVVVVVVVGVLVGGPGGRECWGVPSS